MITYNNKILLGGIKWLRPEPAIYTGKVATVVYKTVNYTISGGYSGSYTFNKYDLVDTVKSTSGILPGYIEIPAGNRSNEYGYRITDEEFDNNLSYLRIGDDPGYGLYLDRCYNKSNSTIGIGTHTKITLERNCLNNVTGTLTVRNTDNRDPVFFGNKCCSLMDLEIGSNCIISKIGEGSFRNITVGAEAIIGEFGATTCVNMTQPVSFGNRCMIFSDLEPFILAHKDRCDKLGIKALSFAEEPAFVNATYIVNTYGDYIEFRSIQSYRDITLE